MFVVPPTASTYVITVVPMRTYTEAELQAACEIAHAVDRGAFYLAPPCRP